MGLSSSFSDSDIVCIYVYKIISYIGELEASANVNSYINDSGTKTMTD